jgi:hypothetical protein
VLALAQLPLPFKKKNKAFFVANKSLRVMLNLYFRDPGKLDFVPQGAQPFYLGYNFVVVKNWKSMTRSTWPSARADRLGASEETGSESCDKYLSQR